MATRERNGVGEITGVGERSGVGESNGVGGLDGVYAAPEDEQSLLPHAPLAQRIRDVGHHVVGKRDHGVIQLALMSRLVCRSNEGEAVDVSLHRWRVAEHVRTGYRRGRSATWRRRRGRARASSANVSRTCGACSGACAICGAQKRKTAP
jgi:hypothetical protein